MSIIGVLEVEYASVITSDLIKFLITQPFTSINGIGIKRINLHVAFMKSKNGSEKVL